MNLKSRFKKRFVLITMFVMALLLSGCGEKQQDTEKKQSENGTIVEDQTMENGENAEKENPEKVSLPEIIFSEEALQKQLMDMIDSLEETREESFLATGLTREEIDNTLTAVKESKDVYHQYYIAECNYTYELEHVQDVALIHLQTEVVYYDDVVPLQNIISVASYEEAYGAMEEGFHTGFETVVLTFSSDLNPEYIRWMPEELIWNDSLDMPFGFKKVLYMDFEDQGNHLMTLRLEYDCYGVKEEQQVQASLEVKQLVEQMALEVEEQTKLADKEHMRETRCRVLYDLVQERVDFDYKLNDYLLDLEGNNDPYVATRRSIYGALVYGESVCSGYATLFDQVCKQLQIPSWVLSGYAENGDHAWNMVILDDGKVAYLDPTWGDSKKWHDTYLFMSTDTYEKENRRVYDFLYVPKEFYEAGYVENTAPPCLYDEE